MRPFDSAATVKPHRIDFANESSTDFRSSGFLLLDRNDWLPCTSITRGPTRSNRTMRLPPPAPPSEPGAIERDAAPPHRPAPGAATRKKGPPPPPPPLNADVIGAESRGEPRVEQELGVE